MSNSTPGLVCAHHHLYSTLARGMPSPPTSPTDFLSTLQQIWWRLDAQIDEETLYWSAALGAAEALLSGTTSIIDHHESPRFIEGSLDVIARACSDIGVRVNTCFGVTDRWANDGSQHSSVSPNSAMTESAHRGLAECDRYLSAGGRGMVGVHAAFTCSNETLEAAAELAKKHAVGVHIHVAEGADDANAGARLEHLATDDWLLVHCVLLDRQLKGRIVHNPRSNMNNSVGYAQPTKQSNTTLLGTDGIGSDMLEEFRLGYARLREFDISETPLTPWSWLENGYHYFPEARTDKIVWSYDYADDPWKLAFSTGVHPIDVTVDGEQVIRDGVPTKFDLQEVRRKASEQATKLHERL